MKNQWKICSMVAGAALLLAGCGAQSATFKPHHDANTDVKAAAFTTGQLRTYYIAAEEVQWDYAPNDRNDITGEPFTEDENVFVEKSPTRIGDTYKKALYREYDASFKTLKPRDPSLGMLGPVIRAVVGDTIKVVFKNKTTHPISIHPHGVFYTKANEGAPYSDGTSGTDKADDAVLPGATYTYNWAVPERAGPGPMDGSSVLWMYHSHTDEVADTNAGLVGPMVVTANGKARADGTPNDVDREIFSYFTVENENESLYLDDNLPPLYKDGVPEEDADGFEESNLMHAINGYVYGNGPVPTVRKGQRVRWYDFTLGTEVDLHTPHWHGNTVLTNGMRSDMIQMMPGMMMSSDMVPDAVGTWLYHCHVNDHILAGMMMRYKVTL